MTINIINAKVCCYLSKMVERILMEFVTDVERLGIYSLTSIFSSKISLTSVLIRYVAMSIRTIAFLILV